MISQNCSSCNSYLNCGLSNTPSLILIFSQDKAKIFLLKNFKQSPSWSNAFTNCFIRPSFICNGGSKTFLGLTSSLFKTFCSPILKSLLSRHVFCNQCYLFAWLSQRQNQQSSGGSHQYIFSGLPVVTLPKQTHRQPDKLVACM